MDLKSKLNEEFEKPDKWFLEVSKMLFFNYQVNINGGRYKIIEIELYYKSDSHKDVFVHGDIEQKKCATWYLHKKGEGFKEGNFVGVDITFGNQSRYGGILIRGLQNLNSKEIIDGSGLVAKEFQKCFDVNSAKELNEVISRDILNNNDVVVEKTSFSEEHIYMVPRKGLSLKKDVEERIPFIFKRYRAFAGVPMTKKSKMVVAFDLYLQGINPVDIGLVSKKKLNSLKEIYNESININYNGMEDYSDKTIIKIMKALGH